MFIPETMESDEEIIGATRPKRQTRPPARLQDFEVQYVRGRPGTEYASSPSWEVPPHMTPRQSSRGNPDYLDDDAAPRTVPRLRPSLSYTDHRETLPQSFTSAQRPSYPEPESYNELQAIRRENAQLLQSQQAFRADLMELKAVRTELKELVQVAQTLRADLSPSKSHHSPPVRPVPQLPSDSPGHIDQSDQISADLEECLELPPWPEPEPELRRGMETLKLSKPRTATYEPEVPKYTKVSQAPLSQPYRPSQYYSQSPDVPPLPPTPEDLRELLSSAAPPSYWKPSRAQIPVPSSRHGAIPGQSSLPATAVKVESNIPLLTHPSSTEYVYRGPTPSIPKFSRPDPSEFARLRIALENLLPPDGTELFKYQILVDHLKLDEAKLIADAFLNSPTPFTDTMVALHEKFGQPHQLALRKIASVLEAPDVRHGDTIAFQKFALQVQSLVGLLKTLGPEGDIELNCGSHVARLLSKLPSDQRAEFRRHMFRQPGTIPTLHDLSNWLRYEAWCHDFDVEIASRGFQDRQPSRPVQNKRTVAVLHGVGEAQNLTFQSPQKGTAQKTKPIEVKRFCPFCDSTEHYLSQCKEFAKLTTRAPAVMAHLGE